MSFPIRVVAIADNGQEQVHEITSLQRTELKMETLGLTLAEGKAILSEIQHVIVGAQRGFTANSSECRKGVLLCSTVSLSFRIHRHRRTPCNSLSGSITTRLWAW